MKLYEKTGDHKVTGLKDGTRVSKQDVRVHLMGELDELNSHIGLVRSLTQNKALSGRSFWRYRRYCWLLSMVWKSLREAA